MLCLTAGFAYNSNHAVVQQLKDKDAEAKEVAAKLDAARAALLKEPGNQDLRHMVQKLEVKEAGLDEMRKTLVAALSGTTHADAWAFLPAFAGTAGA